MTDFFLDSLHGNDNGSGSLTDPWSTISRAIKEASFSPTINLQPGTYAAGNIALLNPITLAGLGAGVIIEPASTHSPWSQSTWSQTGSTIWHASTLGVPAGKTITQATWQVAPGPRHRIPVWNPTAPLDTLVRWADAVLSPNNPHTRWGLYSTSTDLYLIPPVDGSWTDPNTVRVLTGWAPAFRINGPDISLSNLELPSHACGVRLDSAAARTHLSKLTTDCCNLGIGIYGSVNPITYGHDHLIELCTFRDRGHCIPENELPPMAGQGISWNLIKNKNFNLWTTSTPLLVNKALSSSETVGVFSSGGSLNSVVQDCVFDGTFDGDNHYEDGRFDANADTNLTFRRCEYKNITDDSHDRSRHQNGVVYEDCTHRNVGTILSPAPLWGSVSMRRCTGSMIGEQVRVTDGTNRRPPGSVIKYGAIDPSNTQGQITLEDCIYWSDTPTTQGICPDGGDGVLIPKMTLVRTTLRVPYIVLNWGAGYPHPDSWLTLIDATLSSSGIRPLKVSTTKVILTPASIVDALYYSPKTGDFTLMTVVDDLNKQIADLQALISSMQASLAELQAKVNAFKTAQSNLLS